MAWPVAAMESCSSRVHVGAQFSVDARRRRLLDDFLEAPLQRAFALEKMRRATGAATEYLHLDMAGVGDKPLQENSAVAKRPAGQLGGRLGRVRQLRGGIHLAHADSPAAGRGLDE